MKFYNPFKPHIVQVGVEGYAIRVSSLLFWSYLDKEDVDKRYWWNKPLHVKKWCLLDTYEDAAILLENYIKLRKVIKSTYIG